MYFSRARKTSPSSFPGHLCAKFNIPFEVRSTKVYESWNKSKDRRETPRFQRDLQRQVPGSSSKRRPAKFLKLSRGYTPSEGLLQ
jgi:hypothetical protein